MQPWEKFKGVGLWPPIEFMTAMSVEVSLYLIATFDRLVSGVLVLYCDLIPVDDVVSDSPYSQGSISLDIDNMLSHPFRVSVAVYVIRYYDLAGSWSAPIPSCCSSFNLRQALHSYLLLCSQYPSCSAKSAPF